MEASESSYLDFPPELKDLLEKANSERAGTHSDPSSHESAT